MPGCEHASREDLLGLHRDEYGALKDEQRARLTTRDHLAYATWGGIGLVLAAGRLEAGLAPLLWLALPVVVVVLGWTRTQNDLKIARIGRYIGAELAPRVSGLVGGAEVFCWERSHNGAGTGRRLRMVCQLLADLLLYLVVPAAALVAFWAAGPTSWLWTAVSVGEAGMLVGLAAVIVAYSGVRGEGRDIGRSSRVDAAPAETHAGEGR